MQSVGISPDAISYEALVEALWSTGVRAAQRRAALVYGQALRQHRVKATRAEDVLGPPRQGPAGATTSPAGERRARAHTVRHELPQCLRVRPRAQWVV